MNRSRALRLGGFAAAIAASAALIGAATGATGAYFTDSAAGTVSGTVGSIKITGSGGTGADHLNLKYDNMLPGEPQTATATFTNTGTTPQDVWIVFPNATALSALNDLGNYGLMTIKANDDAKFISENLNDHATCPPGTSDLAHLPHPQNPCNALPSKIKLFSNVAVNGSGQVSLTFSYVWYLAGSGGGVFNTYPVSGQTTVNAGDGSGAGLPYQLVATQVGQTP